jgi:hypothetical protein
LDEYVEMGALEFPHLTTTIEKTEMKIISEFQLK